MAKQTAYPEVHKYETTFAYFDKCVVCNKEFETSRPSPLCIKCYVVIDKNKNHINTLFNQLKKFDKI